MTKLYSVDFIKYTNCLYKTVCNDDEQNCKYIDAPKGEFIAKEEDLPELQKFGGGIKEAVFAGYLYEG